jgi:hypothetical protein
LALTFETFFPLALLNRRLRNLFLATAVVFHSLNYIFLKIVFHPMIITYLAFVDWQWLYQRFWPRKRLHLPRLSNTALIALALLAGGLSVAVFSLGHPLQTLLPEPLFWAVATPVSLVLALKYLLAVVRVDLLGSLKRWRGRPRDPDDSTLQAPEVS